MKAGNSDEYRPRVFLSCGQHTLDERLAAQSLGDILRKKGYSVFIATEQTSFEGVKEGIFPNSVMRNTSYLSTSLGTTSPALVIGDRSFRTKNLPSRHF